MRALFDKHRKGMEGLGLKEFEALLFRLLCFLPASEEILLATSESEWLKLDENSKNWREKLIQKNPRKFSDVYEIQNELGKGSYGTVCTVTHKTQHDMENDKRTRVCKTIQKAKAIKAKTPEAKVREEFAVLKQLDHPHVLRIFEDLEDEKNFYLIMEPCHGGDLG